MTVQIIGHNDFACRFQSADRFELSDGIARISALDGDLEVPVTSDASITVEPGEYTNAHLGVCILSVSGSVKVQAKDGQVLCEAWDDPKFKLRCKRVVFTDILRERESKDVEDV
jgi:hypothetical protein